MGASGSSAFHLPARLLLPAYPLRQTRDRPVRPRSWRPNAGTTNGRCARWERLSASPAGASAIVRLNLDIDVRGLLRAIRVPTLVLRRAGDMVVPIQAGRYIGEHVPGARFVELPGIDHAPPIGDVDRLIGE